MNKEKMFIARDENNKEVAYEMLLVKEVNNTPIIWYTDGSLDKEGKKNIYISSYKKEDGTFILESIEDKNQLNEYANIFLNEFKEN